MGALIAKIEQIKYIGTGLDREACVAKCFRVECRRLNILKASHALLRACPASEN